MAYYATYLGHIDNQIFTSWDKCRREITKRPKFKKCDTLKEAEQFQKFGPFTTPDMAEEQVYVYTCRGGFAIYFGPEDSRNYAQRINGETAHRVDLLAIIECMKHATDITDIFTVSQYAVYCSTTYGEVCKGRNWDETIPNIDLVKILHEQLKSKLVHVDARVMKCPEHASGINDALCLYEKSG